MVKYAVDRIENNVVIMEDLATKDLIEINLSSIDMAVKEGDIIEKRNDEYIVLDDATLKRREEIEKLFHGLRKNDSNED